MVVVSITKINKQNHFQIALNSENDKVCKDIEVFYKGKKIEFIDVLEMSGVGNIDKGGLKELLDVIFK